MKSVAAALLAHVVFRLALMAQALPPAEGIVPAKVVELASYTEGVVAGRNGELFVSEPLGGRITRIAGDRATTWAKTGAPNGHKILGDGTHLVCDGSARAVLKLDAEGRTTGTASRESEGSALRAPNDLTVGRRGFYFTDPGGSTLDNPIGTVHFVNVAGETKTVARGLAFPNGVTLSADERALFVAESQRNRILKFEVRPDGALGPQQVFAELPRKSGEQIANEPDGIALDADGNLFVAHYGMRQVQVVTPDGSVARRYPAGNLTTSNVAFAGADGSALYVTGAIADEKTSKGAVFRLDLPGVRGRTLPLLDLRLP
jgi:gluconolactonase